MYLCCFFFFFQAEDGIRDLTVTGVQTCALPISVAQVTGLPPKVEMVNPWNESAISGLATVRPTGTPFPMPLAAVIMSGSTSQCSMPNHLCPVRPQAV